MLIVKRPDSARRPLVRKESDEFIVEPGPIDLVGQHEQRVLHVDDPIETGAEKIVMPHFFCGLSRIGTPE